jgi:NAD(P)-dependent dehydrogenase (short-subunit alcohol dehydrogenase family)
VVPISYVSVDVSQEAQVDAAVDAVAAREGRLDYLVCCAAVFYAGGFLEISPDAWMRTMDVNVLGPFLCCRAALRHMRPRQYGRMVLFPSMIARRGGPGASAYATSKGGVLGLARSLALEVAAENIRVNTLTPGITDTPQPRGHQTEEEIYAKGKNIPLGRIAEVEDLLEPCLFLLSDDSSYLTGQDLRVTGGAYLW